MQNQILAVVANYDHSSSAKNLKEFLSTSYPTLLIDSSSPTPPVEAIDITIANEFYRGLWNQAAKEAIKTGVEWLFFIASDVVIVDKDLFFHCINQAADNPCIGLYSPSLTRDSRCSFASLFNSVTSNIRECSSPEGFCFLIRTSVLLAMYPIPPSNKFGYKVDVVASQIARRMGFYVAVDDRITICHPQSRHNHLIPVADAVAMGDDYCRLFGLDPTCNPPWEAFEVDYLSNNPLSFMLEPTKSLDLGCGHFPRNPFKASEVFGVDVRTNQAHPNIVGADLVTEKIPFPDHFFDCITAFDFIEHIPRVVYLPERRLPFVELMNEVYRCLKPGGLFLSLTPAFPKPQAFQDPTHVNIITEETFSYYFDDPNRWASMYGFSGSFKVEQQRWEEHGKLLTIMRSSLSKNCA